MTWMQQDAIALCRKVEAVCPTYGCHVALTGGSLYKEGQRKDADILFYRIRGYEQIKVEELRNALTELGFSDFVEHGWVWKARYNGKGVDMFFPEPLSCAEIAAAEDAAYQALKAENAALELTPAPSVAEFNDLLGFE